jgi:hypothetical protein
VTFFTHINRGVIDANRKNGTTLPAVSFRSGRRGKATYAMEVEIPGPSRVIYSPHEPLLPCGARMVIASETQPVVVR